MKSFYGDRFGAISEFCYIGIDKEIITKKERDVLIDVYKQHNTMDHNSHRFNKDEVNELTTRRRDDSYYANGNFIDRSKNYHGRGGYPVRVVHVKINHPVTEKLQNLLGSSKLRYSFFYTKKHWISTCHCEIRTPSVNVCLIDSGAPIFFFDEEAKVVEEHKFRVQGSLVIYNTARWHMIHNLTSGDRLTLSINVESDVGIQCLNRPFPFRASEIYDQILLR